MDKKESNTKKGCELLGESTEEDEKDTVCNHYQWFFATIRNE